MSLNDWLEKGWLLKHRPDRRETRALLGIADRDITDAQAQGTSTDTFRKKRNISDYEQAGAASDQEAREVLDMAKTLREMATTWLKKNHPDLML